jgi:SAM-dependent methyltransferase
MIAYSFVQMFEGVNEEIQTFEENVELTFDYRGWTSSFDRKHISAGDMAEWIDTTVERILDLDCFRLGRKPRILEIGSGTGMILFRIAPQAEKYVGLDLTEAVVNQVREHSRKLKYDHVEVSIYLEYWEFPAENNNNTKVHVSPAHLFEQVLTLDNKFDLVRG